MSPFTRNIDTTSDEVATAAFADQIKGKNVLITGTSVNGVGFESARVIAKYANLIIITGYNLERFAEFALAYLVPGANIRPLVLNLASLDAVRSAAAEVNAYPEHIDVLINNAASSLCGFSLTADGFERQIATAHLGPFLFTALILPKILSSQTTSFTPRVVYVASGAHAWCDGVDFEELERPNPSTYKGMRAYAQAKSANILTAIELTRRAAGRIHAYSLTPGAVSTNFVESGEARSELLAYGNLLLTPPIIAVPDLTLKGIITEDGKPNPNVGFPWKTLPQAAATIIVAAFDTSLEGEHCFL
ncbi:NAD(P)-binding protein [Mycena vitilis]|nr:NAD(P)-binding protein [Mycena vitilis]